ncbi:hypothetical protein [Methanohalophilus profundi]|uniref:hypothetical protein n=1 Tax=Methanohalophilus profundi TaxID=2138083 RepID=UPI001CDC4B00|nr:hypothetical protein [Methanohalophilus profundi]
MKKFVIISLIIAALLVAGCSGSNGPDEEINQPEIDESDSATDEEQTKPVDDSTDEEDTSLSTDDDTIRVGAFNVQIYGQSKASEGKVMAVLGIPFEPMISSAFRKSEINPKHQ